MDPFGSEQKVEEWSCLPAALEKVAAVWAGIFLSVSSALPPG